LRAFFQEKIVSKIFSLIQYEFSMCVRRPGFWIAYVLLTLFYLITILAPSTNPPDDILHPEKIWPEAGHTVFLFNIFMPLLAGILSADRMQRDFRGGMRELQRSAPLSIPGYILAKYLGILASVLLPMFLLVAATGLWQVARGHASVEFLWPLFLAFLSIAVPAHAFVVAFSLACPLVLPLRVYQVLFTGYWFWGNLISPKAFPTISDTFLNAAGQYPLQGFFGMTLDSTYSVEVGFTPLEATLNLLVLVACITITLFVLDRYLRWQESRA